MVDDEILLADRGEAIAAMIADPARIARRIGHEFQIGPLDGGDLAHFVERQHAVDAEHAVVAGAERLLDEAPQLHRHLSFDVEPDHGAAAAALQRGFEHAHQVFGFFENFDFGVADDAERAQSLHDIAGEQLADEQAGHALDRDQPHLAVIARRRQAHEAFDPVRNADQRIHRAAVLGARQLQGDGGAEIGNERERMRRIDRERRQQRKNVGKEIILEPCLFRLGDLGTVDQHDAGFGERLADLAPLRLLIRHQDRHRFGDAGQLLGGRQSFRAAGGDAFAQLRAETGDAHHEELVEIVGGDRQKFQPLQQRVSAIGGLLPGRGG